jgi:hypothetical protein
MPTHAHAQYQLTLYAGEPRRFNIAGRAFAGDTRTSIIIQSGEPHGSVPVDDEQTALRTFYIDETIMEEAAAAIWHRQGTVAFHEPRLTDPATVAALHAARRWSSWCGGTRSRPERRAIRGGATAGCSRCATCWRSASPRTSASTTWPRSPT